MPKCECKHCLNLSNGKGRVLHRTTVARHLLEEKEAQALEDEYQRLHPEENFYHSEEENLYEENLREEDLYEENERSFMVTSDNEEENERSYMEMCDNEEIPEETNDDFSFQNEENEKTNNYENDHYYYYENDDSISDSQNESESDNINSNANNEEGVLENERKCKFCKEDRYYSNGKSRKNLPFVSIIERLKLQFKNSKRSKELLYRHNYTNNIGDLVHRDIGDIFDGLIYKELLNDAYFPDPRDVAFTASCDGYQIFRQKTDDCWVFLFINNNLPQELRVKKENLMVTLIIPGPKQPQDFNSFLYPLIQEMKMLQDGILCYDGNKKEYFTLRAHILAWTGDLPALSKILYLTGHNSYSGCRFCNLRGTLNEMNRHVYYPLQQKY
ncbi:transposase domain-containing protein [Rhizophagus irregularis DAOM 181602=DAOM 197198]|nr:transposase domain-containing protein [Rhizophagus irregularis DAOM 181602=DAOM 197198]